MSDTALAGVRADDLALWPMGIGGRPGVAMVVESV